MSRKLPDFGPQVEALAKTHGISEHLTSIPTISRYLLSQYFSDTPECSVSKVCAALLDLAKQACGDGPADYLVRALGILEKFSEPANRTVEVTDGQHRILVWQVQEDLMQPGKLDFPEGSGRRWPSTTMRATRGLSSGGDAPHIHVGGQLGPLERHAPWEPAPLDHGGSQESAPLTSTHVGAPPTCQGPRHCQ